VRSQRTGKMLRGVLESPRGMCDLQCGNVPHNDFGPNSYLTSCDARETRLQPHKQTKTIVQGRRNKLPTLSTSAWTAMALTSSVWPCKCDW
jgi:hypothetical protein